MQENSKLCKFSIFICACLFISLISLAYAEIGETKKLDTALKNKITKFLADKGHANVTLVDGKEVVIQNGYFLQLDGIDKSTKKDYLIEIVCSQDNATWILLTFKEKNAQDVAAKK